MEVLQILPDAYQARNATLLAMLRMVRALLADRFKLLIRTEPREREVFALSIARGDGRLGPELRRAQSDCEPPTGAALMAGQPSGGRSRTPNHTTCGTITELVERVERELQTEVFDRTGLTGRWDYSLTYFSNAPPPVPGLAPLPPQSRQSSEAMPALSTALQEQLGLRLERSRGRVDVWTIQSVERPTEN